MTKITYLSHSGFAVTLDKAILVFDYYRDPSHALHRVLEDNPGKPVVFFVSHRHKDHFKPEIFEIAQNHKRLYVISNDVPAQVIPSTLDVAGMSAGDIIDNLPGDITVKAYGSTDKGVSFMVTDADGEKIFHAGDLNDWQWIDEMTPQQMEKAHAEFRTIVNRIAEENPSVSVLFFPVDTRLGADAGEGAKYFMEKIEVADFFPMHFNGDYRQACDFKEYAPDGTSCHCLREPGESIELSYQKA